MFPILFYIGDFPVQSYYAFNIIGIFFGFVLLYFSLRKTAPEKIRGTFLFALIIFIPFLIGGRAGYMIEKLLTYEPACASGNIIFGPVSLWWGLVLATLLAFPIAKSLKTDVWETADFFAPSIALGGFFARLACLFNGCCIGTPAPMNLPVIFYPYNSYAYSIFGDVPLHPAPLYEALAWILILIILLFRKKSNYFRGELITIMAFLYAVSRFFIEFLRYHEIPEFPSYAQMFSVLILISSISVWIIRKFILKIK